MSTSLAQMEDLILHEALNGQVSIEAPAIDVVNPTESLPVGIGPWADQPFFTGASQNVRTTWTEQGWGHDSQRWPTYPYSVGDNPARRKSPRSMLTAEQRTGEDMDSWTLAEGHEAERQGMWASVRRSGAAAHGAVVEIPDAVPYTDMVPAYAGGAVAHPGVDIPLSVLYG